MRPRVRGGGPRSVLTLGGRACRADADADRAAIKAATVDAVDAVDAVVQLVRRRGRTNRGCHTGRARGALHALRALRGREGVGRVRGGRGRRRVVLSLAAASAASARRLGDGGGDGDDGGLRDDHLLVAGTARAISARRPRCRRSTSLNTVITRGHHPASLPARAGLKAGQLETRGP